VESAARKFRRQAPGVGHVQPTISARAIPMASSCAAPSNRDNHETDNVGGTKRQAGVDKVGNWRDEGQVLPLCADLRMGVGVLLVGFHWGRCVATSAAE
jgi:hypothetical protein